MSYKPKFLGHVNIFVRNVDRSRGWYEEVLGLHTYDVRSDRAAFMPSRSGYPPSSGMSVITL